MKDRLALPVLTSFRKNTNVHRQKKCRTDRQDQDRNPTKKDTGDDYDDGEDDNDADNGGNPKLMKSPTKTDGSNDENVDDEDIKSYDFSDNSGEDQDNDDDVAFYGGGVRCQTGSAVITGPNRYGSLAVPYVIHAVGPSYFSYDNFAEPDELLHRAYTESMRRCQENGVTDVAFSLLSAGIFRGQRDLGTVLCIGITAIQEWAEHGTLFVIVDALSRVVQSFNGCCGVFSSLLSLLMLFSF